MLKSPSYQCVGCGHTYGLPLDNCSICGEHFYWRVIPVSAIDDKIKTSFQALMQDEIEPHAESAFLFHENHLWLPHNFWEVDPNGLCLESWGFVSRLECHQHSTANAEETSKAEPDSKLRGHEYQQAIAPQDSKDHHFRTFEEPKVGQSLTRHLARTPSQSKESGSERENESMALEDTISSQNWRKIGSDEKLQNELLHLLKGQLFVPLMIFLFFIFLSLSTLALDYYKLHKTSPTAIHSEAKP